MEDDAQLVQQLGGFALDNFLSEFTGEQNIRASGLSALGLSGKGRGRAVDASQIYSERYEDDDVAGPSSGPRRAGGVPAGARDGSEGIDWEDEIDREMDEEDALMGGTSSSAYAAPLSKATKLRGEDDDFDEDDDEVEAGPPARNAFGQQQQQPLPADGMEDEADYMHMVKQEETEEDAAELAAQQQLFQQSIARMQAAQQPQDQQDLLAAFREPSAPLMDVATLYPSFAPDKVLNFTELFVPRPRKRARIDPSAELYPLPQPSNYSTAPSTRDFRSHRRYDRTSAAAQYLLDALREQAEGQSDDDGEHEEAAFEQLVRSANAAGWKLPLNMSSEQDAIKFEDWEDKVVWDNDSQMQLVLATQKPEARKFGFKNADLESGDWARSVIWSERAPFKDFTKLQLNLNDPAGPAAYPRKEIPWEETAAAKQIAARSAAGTIRDPFNLANDKLYEVRREQKKTVRQTFGQLEVQHTYPAMKLQFPWYKTQLSKAELRSFHRLPIQFATNIPLSFSKVRSSKKKKDKAGRKLKKDTVGAEAFRTMGDISLSNTGSFVLLEYSEENPMIISNIGMGNIIVNYYRKTDASDSYIPKAEMGEPFLLDPSDESPFMRFGEVEPGQMIPALYNMLVRAPLFKHHAYDTDFVVAKTTIDGVTKFYVRDIKHVFVVGQTYPRKDVPGPQSRKLTSTAKFRLQSIAYKLVSKSSRQRVKIGRLLKYFPDQTEMQMRQRLKEFMEYNRAGEDQGYWKIKQGKLPEEEELFKLIGPEEVIMSESTQVGQRNLLDAGLSSTVDEDKGKDTEESQLDIRQQLAPWFTSKNFLNATQNKAMLKLHGEGDPSSRGEGFSFLRVSMKDIFLRAGEKMEDRLAEIEARPKSAHRYNVAEQQAIYRAEIDRIWKAQFDALSSPYEPMVTEADEIRWRNEELKMEKEQGSAYIPIEAMSPGGGDGDDSDNDGQGSKSASPAAAQAAAKAQAAARAAAVAAANSGPPKVLRIRRLIDGVWRSEIVRDQGVIKGYMRQRLARDADEEEEPENLAFNGDPVHDAAVRKKLAEQLDKLRKNQERRLQRKNAKMGVTGDVFLPGGKKVKNETTRRCGNCGQIGHMKTNRKCPKWAEFNAANNQQPGANASADLGNPFAVGLPGLAQGDE